MTTGRETIEAQPHFYKVSVGYQRLHGLHQPLGTWEGLAKDRKEASSVGLAKVWDPKLDESGAKPQVRVDLLPRYLLCPGVGTLL